MIFLMAWRNIWRNKMRSMVIMLSIAIGLFAGIAVLALYKGMMVGRVSTLIKTETGHLQIHNKRFKNDLEPQYIISNGATLLKNIRLIADVKLAAPRSLTSGMLSTTTGSAGIQIYGVMPSLEDKASQLHQKIIEGKDFDPTRKNEIMIGKKLAEKMKLKIGSRLVLTFIDTASNMVAGAFKVAAIYQSDNAPLDEKNVYVNRKDLNALLGIGQAFHEVVVLLYSEEDLEKVKNKLQGKFPGYEIETWRDISPETDLLVKTVDQYSYIIMVIILFALAFGILNTMLMAVLERTREIGMMVALGTNRIKIFLLICLETIFLTLAGTPIGILFGWLVTSYFHRNGLNLSDMGKEMMSSFGFSTLIYPEFPTDKLAGILIIVTCTAIFSCLFPAMKALKLQPVEALRR